ncbi:MAG: peptidase M4 family protein [Myxococcales bacterium]|nr:peptidase M4 family protein [Myxococcales bacterium]
MNHHLLVLALVATVGACDFAPPDPTRDDAQERALAALSLATGRPWTVRYHARLHTPAFLEGRTAPIAVSPEEAPEAARDFLHHYRALFKLAIPEEEFRSEPVTTDELGMSHVRFVQQHGGIGVRGGQLTAHFDRDGALVRIHGRYTPLPALDLAPAIAADDARLVAGASVRASRAAGGVVGKEPPETLVGQALLAIDPGGSDGESARLAWVVEVAVNDPEAPARLEVLVDAATGGVFRTADLLDDLAGSGIGVFGDRKPLLVAARSGRFYLEDDRAGAPSQRVHSSAGGRRLPGTEVSSTNKNRFDEVTEGRGAAVDAHAYLAASDAYFRRLHGRSGALDDGAGLVATVHYGHRYNNAYWNGRQLVFGDGDGLTFAPLAGALDVVAHEYTHAVIQSSSSLGHQGQSGALNEAIADLFGCFVERYTRGGGNWRVGEEVYHPGHHDALRDLADPHRTRQPAHWDERVVTSSDRGGVHKNSTIASHAGYLMTDGGENSVSGIQVSGIGVAAAERVWYRALTRYLGPSSDFLDAADATVAAAHDLYGAAGPVGVARAWQAVGVMPEE